MSGVFVIPDCHGRYDLVEGLLRKAGLLNDEGARDRALGTVVQLGDLANCTARDSEGDLKLLRVARGWFDVILVGNHEHPYLGAVPWRGFLELPEVGRMVKSLPWQPACAVGDTLITHAGVTPLLRLPESPQDAVDVLAAAWRANPLHPYFTACGRLRGGLDPSGGILWSDVREPRDSRFNQLHGHTPLREGPGKVTFANGRWSVDLDVGAGYGQGRIVGAWLDEAGALDEYVEYREGAAVAA